MTLSFALQPYTNSPPVEADDLSPDLGWGKRSVPASQIRRRGYYPPQQRYLAIGDKPWYCFWNATVEEFWIFLEKDIHPTSASSAAAMTTSSSTSSITTAPSGLSATPSASTYAEGYVPAAATTPTYADTPGSAPTDNWDGPKVKRSSPYTDPNSNNVFPKLIKMVEKRKPHSNVQPYCQQMQVLNSWQVMPIPTVPTVCIEETEYAQPTGSNKRWMQKKRGDSTQDLESMCICEWFSAPIPDNG